MLGRDLDRFRAPADLKGIRLGIGPMGSGTEQLMRRVLAELSGLDIVVSTPSIDVQLAMLERGDLDLGAMVISDKAKLLADAVVRRNLDILAMPNAESLTRRLPFARMGMIEAGQLDYVRQLPRVAKPVLQIDTLIVSNGCASDGAIQGLMAAQAELSPNFVKPQQGPAQPDRTADGRRRAELLQGRRRRPARHLCTVGGEHPAAAHLDPDRCGHLGVVQRHGMAHRFRLWRIDANRVKLESEIPELFGAGTQSGRSPRCRLIRGMRRRRPSQDRPLMARLAALAQRCRKQSLSVLVPMGEEMSYRYQETLISDLITALRLYRDRLN